MNQKYLSRKFIVALVALGVIVLDGVLNLDLDDNARTQLVGLAAAYIVTQGAVDGFGTGGPE